MALKAYNNGIRAKEIRCVDAGGVERIIREIRKGDEQWWRGEFDPPTIQGTWTKVADGLYQTKAIIPSYTTPRFLDSGKDTNYVVVSFHSYENYVTCEFFGDFERLTPQYGDLTNGLSGEFYVTYQWADATGTGLQEYTCSLNVFPKSNGSVTSCVYKLSNVRPGFTEDASFVSEYGPYWVVQGVNAHNKMCSDAYQYYSETAVDPWGVYGRSDHNWYNEVKSGTGVTNYICSYNGRAFSVQSLSSSAVVQFCPPGGNSAGWVASEDSYFPASSGWYQREKKDGYLKFFNVNNGRFVEYLPKDMFASYVLQTARTSIGTNITDAEYNNRAVCTLYNETHLEKSSRCAEEKNNPSVVSGYDSEFYFDLFGIPFINLSTREYIFGHYNPSVPFTEGTRDSTTYSYVSSGYSMFDAVIVMTYSSGACTMTFQLSEDWGFATNKFLTGTYPAANYKYTFDQSSFDYVSLLVACVANYGSDVVGDFHEYRLPAGAEYDLATVTWTANGTNTSFNPTSGYVKGTGHYSESDSTFMFVIRPSSLIGTYYHQIVFNHSNVSTSANSKNLEISANLNYFGTTTYSSPQNSIAEAKKLVPVYWKMSSDVEDRLTSGYDGSRFMTSSVLYYPITLTCDWDPNGETFTDDWWTAKYILPIATATPMTIAKATFLCSCINKNSDSLPGIGSLGSLGISFSESHSTSWSQIWNGVFTITMTRSTGEVLVSSTAKANLPRVGENIYTYSRYYEDNVRYLWCTGNPDGNIVLDMFTGEWEWES